MIRNSTLALLTLALSLVACPKKEGPSEADTQNAKEVAMKAAEAAAPKAPPAPQVPGPIPAPADVAAPPESAERTESGLASQILTPSPDGRQPAATDGVEVHYTGWTTDGKMFDSSRVRGRPARFPLNGVIAGWTEGVQLMRTGETRRLWIPENLAYQGKAGRPQGMLVFDIELLNIFSAPATPADVAAPPADAKKTPSGLAYKILKAGPGGPKPSAEAKVKAHYAGWTTDGKLFDTSHTRGEPIEFPLNMVIPGWTEGLQLLSKGDTARLWIPEALAYKGQEGPPKGMLVFDVELVDFSEPPAPPKVPADVAAPPADATKTATGLAYKVLEKGTGTTHPTATSQVEVHYSGWTTDGKMFDSSVTRGKTITFGLNQVIPGWTEGVQLMVEGEKARLWIPEAQAYKGMPGRPQGMLVFDIELIKIK